MSAYVESMISVGEKPWHGLGTVLDEPPTVQDAILQAGLDWKVELHKVSASADLAVGHQSMIIDGSLAICRMFKNEGLIQNVYGIVSKKYEPLQNSEAFEFFQPILDSGHVHLETAGSLKKGEIVWVLAKLDEDIKVGMDIKGDADMVRPYLLLSMGHNGKRSVKIAFTPIRVVCWNTLSMSDIDQGVMIPHRKGVADTVKEASFDFAETIQTYKYIGKVFKAMNSTVPPDEKIDKFVHKMLPMADGIDQRSAELVMRKRENIIENYGAEVQTVWGLYNAFTGFVDHDIRTKNGAEGKLMNAWFGNGAKMKTIAYNYLRTEY